MAKKLYIVRGCSGSGKSTLAKELEEALHGYHIEADMYMYNSDGVYDWQASKLKHAHDWVYQTLKKSMEAGVGPLILSDTNVKQRDLQTYLDLAGEYGYRITSLVVEHRHNGINSHGVSEKTLSRQESSLRQSLKLR